YLWYVLNVITIAFVQLSLHGVTFQFLWPDWPELNNLVLAMSITLNVGFVCLFTYGFLNINQQSLLIRSFVLGLAATGFALCLLALVIDYGAAMRLSALTIVVGAPTMFILGIYLWIRGDILARLY